MPEDEPLHQPNDKLFKQVFSDPATAAGFLSAYLPEALAAAIDWPALQLEAGSFIDSQFRHHESDLLFRAPVSGSEVFIYCLFEHQTREDPWIALRLLRYMVCIWEVWLKKSPGMPLPVILPVVLAQNDRAWKTLPAFSAMFDLPESLAGEMGPFIPDFLFRLVQLSEIPFDAIRGTPAGIMVLRVMKAERTNELLGDPVWDEPLMVQLPPAIFEMLMRFMMNAEVDTEGLRGKVNSIQSNELKTTAMSLAQKLRQEGHQEGRQEGRQEALRDNIIEALGVRFGNVPPGLREEIQLLAEEAKLHQLLRTAIQCPTLEAFAAAL